MIIKSARKKKVRNQRFRIKVKEGLLIRLMNNKKIKTHLVRINKSVGMGNKVTIRTIFMTMKNLSDQSLEKIINQ